MDSLNVSYQLNNLGPWSDPLLSGILGSASSVNMMEPLASALPVISQQPGAFLADHLLGPQQPAAADSTSSDTAQSSTSGASDAGLVMDIFKRVMGQVHDQSAASIAAEQAALKSWLKSGVVIVVALIMLVFGLWILLAPTVKPIVVGAAKEGAKAAAA